MKKLMIVIMVALMLAGCSGKNKSDTAAKTDEKEPVTVRDPLEKYYGTWRTSAVSISGTRFTVDQIEAMGEKESVDVIFIIRQDGTISCYSALNGFEGEVAWKKGSGENTILIEETELTMENNELVFPFNEDNAVYLEKISDRQDDGIAEEIMMKEDENTEPVEETPAEPEPEEKEEVSDNTIRPEIKEAIDAYEAFIDEYCEFMTKYAESDGSDLGLLVDYATFMGKLEDYTEKFDALEDDLTDAEYWYYIEVLNRCNEKMLKAIS